MNRLDLGKFYLTHDKIPAKGAWLDPGAKFLNFGTACIYLDLIKLWTLLISQIVATSQVLADG